MKREEKEKVVADLRDRLSRTRMAVVTDYKGLDVAAITRLRNQLREASVEYRVVKNTLMRLAVKDTDVSKLFPYIKGPCALALSYDDVMAPAKVITEFLKKNEKLQVKAGLLENKLVSPKDIESLAKLPSREVLLSQLLSAMTGVPRGLVSVLHNVLQNFLYVLVAVRDQKEAGAPQESGNEA